MIITEASEVTIILHDIKNTTHLREYENTRSLCFHRLQKLVKDDHLAAILNNMLVGCVWWSGLGAIE